MSKNILDEWNEYVREITESTGIDVQEPAEARRQRIAMLEADPEQWFCYYFPRYTFAAPAPFHRAATERILKNREHYEVRLWSRELAKSTRTMMEVLYLVLVGHPPCDTTAATEEDAAKRLKKKYVLLISNSLDNASRLLMPYRANLGFNKRIIQDYGGQENNGKWQASEFTTLSGASFRAIGAGQSPRGTRNEEVRPDILLFDDVDTDADCLNPEIVAKKWRWIEEAAIGTRSVSMPTTILFCGNRIAVDCCIERASTYADHSEQVNIRDGNGLSTWPEKNTQVDIDRVLSQKSYAATQKEYFNNPVTEGAVFTEMAYKPALPLKEYEALICYTDPSYKDTCDYKATVLVGLWQGEYHIIKSYVEQTMTSTMVNWHFNISTLVAGCRCRYYMESVFIQDVLVKEVNDGCLRRGMPLHVIGDTRHKPDKFTRIEASLEPLNRNGLLYLNENEQKNPHMQRLEEQFKAFAPGSSAHDDAPDAVEGAVWLLNTCASLKNNKILTTVGKKVRDYKW